MNPKKNHRVIIEAVKPQIDSGQLPIKPGTMIPKEPTPVNLEAVEPQEKPPVTLEALEPQEKPPAITEALVPQETPPVIIAAVEPQETPPVITEAVEPQETPPVIIAAVEPQIDSGDLPIKRLGGEKDTVSADGCKEGQERLVVSLKVRKLGEKTWHESTMTPLANDRWTGEVTVILEAGEPQENPPVIMKAVEPQENAPVVMNAVEPEIDSGCNPNTRIPKDYPRVIIEAVKPQIVGGHFPIKRVVGEKVAVSADVYKEGHDRLAVLLKVRKLGATEWQQSPMTLSANDRWHGEFTADAVGPWEYTIEGYAERYLSWVDEITKKNLPGANLRSELLEGIAILKTSAALAPEADSNRIMGVIWLMESALATGEQQLAIDLGIGNVMAGMMANYPDRSEGYTLAPALPMMVNRPITRFAAWYEFFPRSQSSVAHQHGTLQDSIRRLHEVKAMGFDVVYLPPIHPIGYSFRKGKNNNVVASPGDVGSPWAIGNEHGGHMAIEPQLGNWNDWDMFVATCHSLGLEIALDYVMNCSPDHPYVAEHPEWFFHRPDGSIKYAENPPKKYQDVYPLNFGTTDQAGLWQEMLKIFLFWVSKGVTTFRVDNPHTKPVPFWEWVIAEVHSKHPEVIFLAEAFTKPKMMRLLAKVGFAQSYTYFTWRTTKPELTEYVSELTRGEMKEYFTGNFFANTPDILPPMLQTGGRPAFIMRAVLAATLSSVYGIYSGYELCENAAIPGKEEYLDSEKYEIKVRDWNAPGNIAAIITRINQIRHASPALQTYNNVLFLTADNPNIIAYAKMTENKSDIILCVVSLDPFRKQHSLVHLPLAEFGIGVDERFQAHDLLSDEHYSWKGPTSYVEFTPDGKVAHIIKLVRL